MNRILRSLLLCTAGLALTACAPSLAPSAAERGISAVSPTSPTTVLVVRHAEKVVTDDADPPLSAEGAARADALVRVAEAAGVSVIYTTQLQRTRDTARPLAARLNVPITELPIEMGEAATYPERLAAEILGRHRGESVLVVGHSNTVPGIVEALGRIPVPPITEAEYDHLFVVVIPASGAPRVVGARYGQPGDY